MNNKCIICGSQTIEIYHEIMKINYYYCEFCQFISKDLNINLTKENERSRYDFHQNSINDPKYVEYFHYFIYKIILNYCKPGMKGLDFGSGSEPVLATILERNCGFKMDIYDLYYSPLKIYIGNRYDFITSTEVFEHLRNPLDYFKLMKRHLKEDGVLALTTNFHQNSDQHFKNWHYMRDHSHVSFYSPRTFEVIAHIIGFELIYHDEKKYVVFKKKAK